MNSCLQIVETGGRPRWPHPDPQWAFSGGVFFQMILRLKNDLTTFAASDKSRAPNSLVKELTRPAPSHNAQPAHIMLVDVGTGGECQTDKTHRTPQR